MSGACPHVGFMLIPSKRLLHAHQSWLDRHCILADLRLIKVEEHLLHTGPLLQVHRCACRPAPHLQPAGSRMPACQKQLMLSVWPPHFHPSISPFDV